MSKAIAQTVGGKRFAWLLALLAVFVVLAGTSLATESADAAGSGDGSLAAPADQQEVGTFAISTTRDPSDPDVLLPGLYHVGPTGKLMATFAFNDSGAGQGGINFWHANVRDVENNLIGWEHTVCLVSDDGTYTAVDNEDIVDDLLPQGGGGINPIVVDPDEYNWRIQTILGGSDVVAAVKLALYFDNDFQNGDGLDGEGLACVRWWSSQPGEQNVTAVDSEGHLAADWADGIGSTYGGWSPPYAAGNKPDVCSDEGNDRCDDDIGGVGQSNPVVKEWNVLERTTITRTAIDINPNDGATPPPPHAANVDGQTFTVPAGFNAATSRYVAPAQTFWENVFGNHTTSGGAVISTIVVGAKVTFTASGSCGQTIVDPDGNTTLEGAASALNPTQSVTVTSIGVSIKFQIVTHNCSVLANMNHTTTITVGYPANIGSQNPPVPPAEKVTVVWTGVIAEKKVLLAWAGQRILLEYDWRLHPGGLDQPQWAVDGPDEGTDNTAEAAAIRASNRERCVFGGSGIIGDVFISKFLKQFGPGTFLSNNELGGLTAIANLFLDLVSPNELNNFTLIDSCVSRAVYESNEPGQVDISLQVTDVCSIRDGFPGFPAASTTMTSSTVSR